MRMRPRVRSVVSVTSKARTSSCQPAMSSRAYEGGGVLVPAEHHIGAFHDWVLGRIGG